MLFRGMTVVAALTLLAACSSDPTPVEPDPSPTAIASSTPAIPVPTMPAQASEDSPEGAAAFVKHYVDVFNYAAATGDVDELSDLSSPDCEGCQKYIDLYRDTYEAGGYFKGGDWKIGDLRLEFDANESFATTTVHLERTTYRQDSDSRETIGPTEDSEVTFGVTGTGPSRRISQLALGSA
jgi:hypothetical protein